MITEEVDVAWKILQDGTHKEVDDFCMMTDCAESYVHDFRRYLNFSEVNKQFLN